MSIFFIHILLSLVFMNRIGLLKKNLVPVQSGPPSLCAAADLVRPCCQPAVRMEGLGNLGG